TEPLYPVDPFESEGVARMFKTHPPLDSRIRRLRELGAGSNGRVSGPSVSELAGEQREDHGVAQAPVGVQQMRPHDALALKPDLLGDALRSKVLGIGDEVDASQPEILERVASEKAKRAGARPVSAGLSR